jgi:alpha-L-fucosidase
VYPTQAGLPCGYFYGPSTLSPDSQTVYLYLLERPKEFVALKGLQSKIKRIRVLGTSDTLRWKISGGAPWAHIPGIVLITVPEKDLDPFVTVLAVDLKEKIKLYRGPKD